MKTLKTIYLLLIVLVWAAFPVLAHADHAWGPYHWARTANPFTLQLGDNLTSADWKSHLAQASQDWNSPQVFGMTTPLLTAIVNGSTSASLPKSKAKGRKPSGSTKTCKAVAGTTQVCNARYGRNGWLGLASISITGGTHITQGLAKMNDTYFDTSTYNNPNERLHVMCQEIAHTFGLDHQSTNGSSQDTCMDYFSNTGGNAGSTLSTQPNSHDFEELDLIYAHLDNTNTVAGMSAFSISADDDDDPNSWGQLMRQSSNGRSSTYRKFHADGTDTLTHIYWTLEAAERCPACDHRFDH